MGCSRTKREQHASPHAALFRPDSNSRIGRLLRAAKRDQLLAVASTPVDLAVARSASILSRARRQGGKNAQVDVGMRTGHRVGQQASADGRRPRNHYHYGYNLPPERHVIEVVQPPFSGNFIINGRRFTAKSPACMRWAAGERIRLVAGDWNGRCVDAVFYNVLLAQPLRDVVRAAVGSGRTRSNPPAYQRPTAVTPLADRRAAAR